MRQKHPLQKHHPPPERVSDYAQQDSSLLFVCLFALCRNDSLYRYHARMTAFMQKSLPSVQKIFLNVFSTQELFCMRAVFIAPVKYTPQCFLRNAKTTPGFMCLFVCLFDFDRECFWLITPPQSTFIIIIILIGAFISIFPNQLQAPPGYKL